MSDRPTPEDGYRTSQARLFAAAGTRAVSRVVRAHDAWAHVIEAGGGPPVLLLHGGGGVAASWVPLVSLLQDAFHLFAPDRPGCGLTDKRSYRGVRLREHAVNFVEGVLDGLGLDRVSLVGSSMGGYWALVFALAHPERVRRLALLGAPAGSARRPPLRQRLLAAPGLGSLVHRVWLRPNRARMRDRMAGRVVARPEQLTEPLLHALYAGAALPGVRRARLSLLRAAVPLVGRSRLTYALGDELAELARPTLLVWGDRDPCDLRWARDLRDRLPAARLEVVPGAGHLVWLDEPQATAGLLRDFLGASGRLSVDRGEVR